MSTLSTKSYSLFNEDLTKYWSIFVINLKNSYAYLGSFVIDLVVIYVRLLTFALIYKVTFATIGASKYAGLSVAQVIWLIMIVQALRVSRDVMSEIADSVKTGQVAVFLNKPFSYPLFQYFSYMGKTLVPTLINLLFGSLVALVLVGTIKIQPIDILLVIPLGLGAMTLIFLQSFIFGIISFWVEDPDAFARIYHKFDLVLGGSMFPIVFFPEGLKNIALLMPWAQEFYSVAKNLILPDYTELIRFYLLQGFWIAFFGLIALWMFNKGLRDIVTNGG